MSIFLPIDGTYTDSLNCAYHGIPCIGYKGLDTQELCFPKLSVDIGDLEKAKVLSQHLKVDKHFYKECTWRTFNDVIDGLRASKLIDMDLKTQMLFIPEDIIS